MYCHGKSPEVYSFTCFGDLRAYQIAVMLCVCIVLKAVILCVCVVLKAVILCVCIVLKAVMLCVCVVLKAVILCVCTVLKAVVLNWTQVNGMTINTSKTKELIICYSTKVNVSDIPLLRINGHNIERVNEFKLLGVTITADLYIICRWL